MASGGRRRGTVLIFVALILILLVVLAYAVLKFMNPFAPASTPPVANQSNNPQVTTAPVVQMSKIWITIQPIKRGTIITSDLVTEIDYPRDQIIEGSVITNKDDVIGKRAKMDLEARVPLNPNLLVDPTVRNSPGAFQIPRGQVAISIPITALSSVSYGLQSGDHVNVITTLLMVDLDTEFQTILPNKTGEVIQPANTKDGMDTYLTVKTGGVFGRAELDKTLGQPIYLVPSESQRPRVVSQTLIQDAVVLHVGEFALPTEVTPTPVPAQGAPTPTPAAGAPTPEPVKPAMITLIVSPQDAITLNYLLIAGGRLNLVMRAAGDDTRVSTEAVTLQFLLDQYNIPNPAKLPYGLDQGLNAPSAPTPLPTPAR